MNINKYGINVHKNCRILQQKLYHGYSKLFHVKDYVNIKKYV